MFVEQPLAYDDFDGLKKLARGAKVPIGVDEGIHSFGDIVTSAKAGAGGVSLKLIKLGGIIAAIEAGKLCQRLGLSVNVAAKIAEFEHLQRGGAASCLRGAEGRLGRQPHAFLSGRGHRAPPAGAQRRAGRSARRPRPRGRGRRGCRGAFSRHVALICYKAATIRKFPGKELNRHVRSAEGPARGRSRARTCAHPGRPLGRPNARRSRRRGDQGRAAGRRRRHPRLGSAVHGGQGRRAPELVVQSRLQPRQTLDRHRLRDAGRPAHRQEARGASPTC